LAAPATPRLRLRCRRSRAALPTPRPMVGAHGQHMAGTWRVPDR